MTTEEKKVLIVLSAFAVLGLAVLGYRNYFARPKMKVVCARPDSAEPNYESMIKQKRIICINTADVNQIESLPEIGPKLAKDIDAYRSVHGRFLSKDGLLKVKGIGKKKFDSIKEYISLE